MGPEVNDHVSLQWPSYEQPHGSNLRPQREQTSWSQILTTGHHLDGFQKVFLFAHYVDNWQDSTSKVHSSPKKEDTAWWLVPFRSIASRAKMHGESFAYSSYTSVLSHLKNSGHDIASENTIYKRKCMHIDHECLETLSCISLQQDERYKLFY
jgi:hypothetical protein